MSASADTVRVLPFVTQVLERDGAATEEVGRDALFVVLPEALRGALELPAPATTLQLSAALDPATAPAAGRQAFPLEGAGMQWCIDRARSRGRRAGARLASPPQNPLGRLEKARKRLVFPNASVVHAEATRPIATRLLLEFGYEAQCEERTEGRVHVALTRAGGIPSVALAGALVTELDGAVAEAPAFDEGDLEEAVVRAGPVVAAEVRGRLERFRADSLRRLEAERERIVAYHHRLVCEAQRRRRVAADVLASKREAILRQRGERLDDLAERHAVAATHWLASVLVLRYEIGLCRFRVRRRRREIDVDVEWDPFLGDFIGRPCSACHAESLYLHVCDAAGHVTCLACASRCAACRRVTCKACRPGGCCDPGKKAQTSGSVGG